MKKLFFLLLLMSLAIVSNASNASPNSNDKRAIIIGGFGGSRPHLSEPTVTYTISTSTITVDFGDQPVGNYCVTISSPLVDIDYYATSPFTTIPIAVDGINDYNIIIETDDGDIFEGTLLATDCHPTERL